MSKKFNQNLSKDLQANIEGVENFEIKRSRAMNAYARLEQNMAMLFSSLLGTNYKKAFIAFSAITNTGFRWVALEKLFKLARGEKHKEFLAGFIKEARKLDGPRNKIVHWMVSTQNRGQVPFDPEKDVFLSEHPNLFGKKKMLIGDLEVFKHKADYFADLLSQFNYFIKNSELPQDPSKTPWSEIFQSKPVYPPPMGHPLDRFHKEP